MKYEYHTIQFTSLDELNELGAQGWRIVSWKLAERGEWVLLERPLP